MIPETKRSLYLFTNAIWNTMLSARFAHLVATQLYMYYTVCTILYGVKIALCTHPLLLDVLRTGVSFKKTTQNKLLYCTRHNIVMDNTPWWITALAPSWPPILAQHWRGTCTDVGTFTGTARSQTHDKNERVRHDFCFVLFFLFLAVDFQQKSMPAWMIGIIIWKLRTTGKIFLEEEVEVWLILTRCCEFNVLTQLKWLLLVLWRFLSF